MEEQGTFGTPGTQEGGLVSERQKGKKQIEIQRYKQKIQKFNYKHTNTKYKYKPIQIQKNANTKIQIYKYNSYRVEGKFSTLQILPTAFILLSTFEKALDMAYGYNENLLIPEGKNQGQNNVCAESAFFGSPTTNSPGAKTYDSKQHQQWDRRKQVVA